MTHVRRAIKPASRLPEWVGRQRIAVVAMLCLGLLFAIVGRAQTPTNTAPLQFSNRAEADRFRGLVAELRCVMCQNQSLADSDAQIAHDLRREVLELMRQGNSDAQVRQFLVARYGEFVLYRPRVASHTWLLWFGPAIVLAAGGVLVAAAVRRRRGPASVDHDDSPQEW